MRKTPPPKQTKSLKSGKQRRSELRTKRKLKTEKRSRPKPDPRKVLPGSETAVCNVGRIAGFPYFHVPEYVLRGYYIDLAFQCRDCGKQEIWEATQQKWWYEVAQGEPNSTAIRCRPCRRREQARAVEARRVSEEGLARKRATRKNEKG